MNLLSLSKLQETRDRPGASLMGQWMGLPEIRCDLWALGRCSDGRSPGDRSCKIASLYSGTGPWRSFWFLRQWDK